MIVTARQGETVDQVCWRIFGRTENITEQVLSLNRGIAALGASLPEGTELNLPDALEAAPQARETVNLWD